MFSLPERAYRRNVGGNPLSFFAVANLYTIEECSQHTKSMSVSVSDLQVSAHSAHDEEISSAHEGLTALPRWDDIQSPKRTHTRHDSQDPVLEKGVYTEVIGGAGGNRSGASTPADKGQPRHSRTMIWLVLAVVTVLTLAIILGAVLGTFVNPSGSKHEPTITEIPAGTTPTPTPTPTTTVPPNGGGQAPQPNLTHHIEHLSVTGWSAPGPSGYFTTWLFSQDADGYLSRHTFNSSTGNWTRVSNFASGRPGTPLAAYAFNGQYYANQPNYDFSNLQYQAGVVYLNNNGYLEEWIFPDSGPAVGQPGSLTGQKYMARSETKLSFYWPSLLYQGMSGEIREARFECHHPDECWHDDVLSTAEASNGTQLISVPMQNNISSTGLFYQEEDGRYVNYQEIGGQAAAVWANQAFSNRIPENASVAAFSTTRPNDTIKLNIYLLWQDINGTVHMSWSDNDNGWKGPVTHQAFAGADNNTALTCSTDLNFPGFPLPAGTELSRCYFQAGAAVREVSFDGTSWDVVGNVPTFGF